MVGEQPKMLSDADYALAAGLHSADTTSAEAVDMVDHTREAFRWACMPSNMQQVS